jgi:hypothetical protein
MATLSEIRAQVAASRETARRAEEEQRRKVERQELGTSLLGTTFDIAKGVAGVGVSAAREFIHSTSKQRQPQAFGRHGQFRVGGSIKAPTPPKPKGLKFHPRSSKARRFERFVRMQNVRRGQIRRASSTIKRR